MRRILVVTLALLLSGICTQVRAQEVQPGQLDQPKDKNALTCALTQVWKCSSKPAVALNITHTVAAFADTYSTQRLFSLCRVHMDCDTSKLEGNPLTKIFQENGKPWAYWSTGFGLFASTYIFERMSTNKRKWVRILAPIAKGGLIVASGIGVRNNVRLYNQKLVECRVSCRIATSPQQPPVQIPAMQLLLPTLPSSGPVSPAAPQL